MKKQMIFFAAALLTAGALLTSCSNEDMTIENPTEQTAKGDMTFTATLAPKDGTATTRSVSESGVTTWVENEKIAVYYQKTDDSYGTASVEATATSGIYGAGIGGSSGSTWGDITIGGSANVTARGGDLAAGIGSGSRYGETAQGTYGTISISTSGTVTATGGTGAAGIGTGIDGTCGNITITSGVNTVDATRDTSDANTRDIGRGEGGTVGTVDIDGNVQTSGGKGYVVVDAYGYNKQP